MNVGRVSRARKLYETLSRFERREWRRRVILLALVLVAPALVSGLALDDYNLLYQMEPAARGTWPGTAPFDLFRWMDPAHNHRLMDGEGYPWWTFEGAHAAFMRPLSSLTHSLDHVLWPHSPFAMHVQSLLWFALLLVLAARAFAEVSASAWVAGVACALFALDDSHGMAVGWIADRNALIAGVFGVATLIFHHRSVRDRSRAHALAALACFVLSLLAAELAVGVAGYLLAYALFYQRGRLRARIVSIVPYAVALVGWALVRKLEGYGSSGLGSYIDPVREPVVFFAALFGRFGEVVASQLALLPSDLWSVVQDKDRPGLIALALLATVPALWFVWPSLRARRSARFWAAGAALCALPVSATLPSDRLLVLVGVGAAALLAQAMYDAFGSERGNARPDDEPVLTSSSLRRAYLAWIVVLHFAFSPLFLPAQALAIAGYVKLMQAADDELPSDPSVSNESIIVTHVPDPALLSFVPVMRSVQGAPRPRHLYLLAALATAPTMERIGQNVLRVSAKDGLFDRELERHSRNPQLPFRVGEHIDLSELSVRIVALTPDRRPRVCDFVFARPLESSAYVWRTFRAGRLVPFLPPKASAPRAMSAIAAAIAAP